MFQLGFIEAVVLRCSIKKMFLEISQNSLEKTCARDFFLIDSCLRPATLLKRASGTGVFLEFSKIFKNTFFNRTPPVAASRFSYQLVQRNLPPQGLLPFVLLTLYWESSPLNISIPTENK